VFKIWDYLLEFVERELTMSKLEPSHVQCTDSLIQLHAKVQSKQSKTICYVLLIEVVKVLDPWLKMVSKKSTAFAFADSIKQVATTLTDILNDSEKLYRFLTQGDSFLFPIEYCSKHTVPSFRDEIDIDLGVAVLKATLQPWLVRANEIVAYREAIVKSKSEQQILILSNALAHSNQAESTVRLGSQSFHGAPHATGRYHDSHMVIVRNTIPPEEFVTMIPLHERKDIRTNCRRIEEKSERAERLRNSRALNDEATDKINEYKKRQLEREQLQQVREAAASELLFEVVEAKTDVVNSVELERKSSTTLANTCRGLSVKCSGTKLQLVQRIVAYYNYKKLKLEDAVTVREIVAKVVTEVSSTDAANMMKSNSSVVDPYEATRLVVVDFETAEPRFKAFYQVSVVDAIRNKIFTSFAKRGYFQKIPGKAGLKFRMHANSPQIKNAPLGPNVTKARLSFEASLNAGMLFIIFHARNNFDFYADIEALKEARELRGHNVTFLNFDKLVKELVPGLKSYALEELNTTFGFAEYDAHDSLADCYATWRVLVFALQCWVGLERVITKENFSTILEEAAAIYHCTIPMFAHYYLGSVELNDEDDEGDTSFTASCGEKDSSVRSEYSLRSRK
jgi:DNA polymerase III epsilon subunit-like protein